VDENYIQHNPRVPTGRAAFVSLLPKLKQHGSKIENKRMIQDGPYIAMHHVWKNAIPFGGNEMAAFHIIRFDSAGLIAEHWNVMSPLAQSPVEGETDIKDLIETEANKTQVINLFSAQQGKRQHKVIGEGNFVLSISEGNHGKKPTAFYDLFRLDQGKIVEQWSVSQEIPQENLANTNTMFNFV
jgi:predicted SnoaL-like aldol condensation-catalyzing enzyme